MEYSNIIKGAPELFNILYIVHSWGELEHRKYHSCSSMTLSNDRTCCPIVEMGFSRFNMIHRPYCLAFLIAILFCREKGIIVGVIVVCLSTKVPIVCIVCK